MDEIQVIDIADYLDYEKTGDLPSIQILLEEWRKAFSSLGFVIITGHGVPDPVCHNFLNDAVAFFQQDLQEKQKLSLNTGYGKGGYVSRGMESVSKTMVYNEKDNDNRIKANSKSVADYVETLEYIRGLQDQDQEEENNLLPVPQYPATFAKHMEDYWDHLRQFSQRLLRISALALGLDENYFSPFFQDHYERLRLAFYPAQDKEKPKEGQLRYAAHTDYACLAIVRQDASPGGLEVLNTNGKWIPVRNIPASFVVNCGDLLQRWTNDCWKSVIHKVVNPPEKWANTHRLSTVLFIGPNQSAVVEPLQTCCSDENPAKYEPIGCKEHLNRKLKISNA